MNETVLTLLANAPIRLGSAHTHAVGALRSELAVELLVRGCIDVRLVESAGHLETVAVGKGFTRAGTRQTALVSNGTGGMVALGDDASVVADAPLLCHSWNKRVLRDEDICYQKINLFS